MRVEEDEQIDRPIAFILAIVALELARLGQNRRPYLADELGRALIETNYRALRIGRFGIEVEHILHAGDVFAIDLRNTPHILAPRLEVILGQAPTHGLPGYAVVLGELDHRAGQQVQRPAGAAFRWARTGSCHQEGFLFAQELASRSGARLFGQRRLQVAFNKAARGPYTVEPPTPTLVAMISSLAPASAASKICARLSLRAACLPPLRSAVSLLRSAWLSSTR